MTLDEELVKSCMINYFSIFPTREHVLNHVLLTIGNGYEWVKNKDGFAVIKKSCKDTRNNNKIPSFSETYKSDSDLVKSDEPNYKANKAFQEMFIEWANKNIDAICKADFHFYGHKIERTRLYEHCGTYSLLAELPDNVHPDWKLTCIRFAEDCLVRIRQDVMSTYNIETEDLVDHLKTVNSPYGQIAKVCIDALNKLITKEEREAQEKWIEEMLEKMTV